MKYKIDGWNNFCRVFEIPEFYPKGYLFGGGKPVVFQMVDWFNPVPSIGRSGITKKEWREKVGEIKTKEITLDELYETLVPLLLYKQYIKQGREYLVICDFGAVIGFKAKQVAGDI